MAACDKKPHTGFFSRSFAVPRLRDAPIKLEKDSGERGEIGDVQLRSDGELFTDPVAQ